MKFSIFIICFFLLGLAVLLFACSSTPTNPTVPVSATSASATATNSVPGSGYPAAPGVGLPVDSSHPLTATVTPDYERTFKQVAGRVPFTVTFGVHISGGKPPYQVAWDFDRSGRSESTAATPAAFVYSKPGAYEAQVEVRDSAGTTVRETRRIVVLGSPLNIPAWRFGVTAHLERRRAGYYPTLADVSKAVALMQAAGVQAARIDFNWDMLNPVQDQWTFQDYDAMVKIVRDHKVDVLGIIDYSSWWASSAQNSDDWRVRLYTEPMHPYDFARYTYQVVSHFKDNVHAWEIWNEENTIGFWKPKPDAAHYTQLLQEAYLAAKYADPNAVVLFGGLSGNGIDGDDKSGLASNFIAGAYAAGAGGYFDVMAIHPYMLPNSGIAAVRQKVAATRDVMNQHGDANIPLWITEIGAPNDEPWWQTAPVQSEGQVAAWLEQVYTNLPSLAPAIFWYDFQDQSIGDPVEQHFGLLRVDYSAKPAYDKFRMLSSR